MGKVLGKGPIYIGANAVLHMGSWSINGTNAVETFVDLEDNAQQSDYGMQTFAGSAAGINALEDTTGQDLLRAAFMGKTKITDIKFYETYSEVVDDKVVYWKPKAGAGGLVISGLETSKDSGSETSKVNFSFSNDGLMERVVETVV